MANSKYHISIAGNIGAGKSSLAGLLGNHFDWAVEYEAVNENPYLPDFYQNMKRWAFHVQVCFLNSRFEQIKKIQASNKSIIQDRSIYEDAYVFAKSLNEQGILTGRDYENYQRLFHSMMEYVKAPNLLIYLQSSVEHLQSNIKKRNRSYEKSISDDYLKTLQSHYEEWLENYDLGSVLTINLDNLDFVNKDEDFRKIVKAIKSKL